MTTVKMVKLGTLIKPAKLQKCGNDNYPVLSMTMHNGLRRWTKGYTIKQPNMDCQPTEITALMRHRAVFS